jgi:hypothetical protein
MWSHLLILGPRKPFPNIAPSLDYGPEHHELIHGATTPWRGGLADEITRSRAGSSAEAEFFSILLVPGSDRYGLSPASVSVKRT